MMQIIFIFWCLLVGQEIFPASRQLSRLDLVRAVNAAANTQAPTATATVSPASVIAQPTRALKKGRPPLPQIPPRALDFTPDQKKTYDLLVSYAKPLKDPLQYAQAANKVRDLIDGKIIGTDPRSIIRQRPELQTTLLAVVLNGLSKDDLISARQNSKLTDEELSNAVEEGRKLNLVLNTEQWLNLDIPKNTSLKDQYLNANDLSATFTDQALSAADSALLADFNNAETKAASPTLLFAGAAATTATVAGLIRAWKIIKEKKLAEKNSQVAEAVSNAADLNVINEAAITTEQKKELNDLLESSSKVLASSNQELTAAVDRESQETILDLTDKEDPDTELNKLVIDLELALSNDGIKVPSPDLLTTFFSNNFKRVTSLIQQLVQDRTSGHINRGAVQKMVTTLCSLPEEFFANIKAALSAGSFATNHRDVFVATTTEMIKTLELNTAFLGITDSSGLMPTSARFHDLYFGLADELKAYGLLTNNIQEIKAILLQMTVDFNVSAITFQGPPIKSSGEQITIGDVIHNHAADIVNSKALKSTELFTILMTRLVNGIKTSATAIVNNPQLFNLFLGSSSLLPEEVPQRIRRRLSDSDKKIINDFFKTKQDIAQQVTTKTGLTFTSNAPAEGVEKELLLTIYPFYNSLYVSRAARPLTIKPTLLSSNDALEQVVITLQALLKLIIKAVPADATKPRNELQTTILESITVRNELYENLALPSSFFTQATATLKNNKNKFQLSEYGFILFDALLKIESNDGEYKSLLSEARDNFKSISFADDQKTMMSNLKLYTDSLKQNIKDLKGKSGELADPIIAEYKTTLVDLLKLVNTDAATIAIIFNCFMYGILFPENNSFFLDDIPEMADAEALKATGILLNVMQVLVRNVDEANSNRAPFKPNIQLKLAQLIQDAQNCELSAADQLTGQAQAIYILLTNSFIKFKKRETYLDGLMGAYAVLQEKDNRTLISKKENAILYSTVFSPKGIFCLPDDINIDKPTEAKLDSLIIEAGFLLYSCVQKNPNELGIKDDAISKSFVAKFADFFNQLKNPSSGAAPDQAAAEQTVKTQTDALAQAAKDDPNAVAATQLIKYITDNAAALSDKHKIGDFVRNISSQLSSASKRKIVGGNSQLKQLIFSPTGLLIAPTVLPSFIKMKDLDDVLGLYKLLKNNPKELGIAVAKGADAKLDKTMNALDAILAALKKLDDIASNEDLNYEDTGSYQFIPENGVQRPKGYTTLSAQLLTGSIGSLKDAVGPQIINDSLTENEWSLKQIDLYNYLYSDGFTAMRAPFMEKLSGALAVLEKMVTAVDQDESFVMKAGKPSKFVELRRILNKKPLEDAFKATVLDIKYLPKNIAEEDFQQDRINMKKFYKMLKDNQRKFEIRAGDVGKIDTIIKWLDNPESAPTVEQETVMSGGLDLNGMNPLMMMMGGGGSMMGGAGKGGSKMSATSMLGMNKSGGLNSAGTGMIMGTAMAGMGGMGMMGMPNMMGGMGGMGMMGMNPYMMGGMGGMGMGMMGGMGMPQQPTLTQEDVKKAVADQKMQDTLQELKTRALVQDMLSRPTTGSIELSADLTPPVTPKPADAPTPSAVSDEEKKEYLTKRTKAYSDLTYKLGSDLKPQPADILALLKDQGTLLLESDAELFCTRFLEALTKYLTWWRSGTSTVTDTQNSELSKMIFSEYGLLVPIKMRVKPESKEAAKAIIKLYEYLKEKFSLTSSMQFTIDLFIKYYTDAKESFSDSSDSPSPKTTDDKEKEKKKTKKPHPDTTIGLPGSTADGLLEEDV